MKRNHSLLTCMVAGFVEMTEALCILYPRHPLYQNQADEPYQAEFQQALDVGISCSLFDFDEFVQFGYFQARPKLKDGEPVLYRGWMMTPQQYQALTKQVVRVAPGARPITSLEDYTLCHHLPGWYKTCQDLTAESHIVTTKDDVITMAAALGWADGFFVKDFVKSNTGSKGSIAKSPKEIAEILDELELYRGELEGGIVLRKLEDYVAESEQRYFVVQGNVWSPNKSNEDNDVPSIVHTIAKERIQAPFYSVDVAQTSAGDWRVVELGDGQVSGIKKWPVDKFVQALASIESNIEE